VGGRLEASTQSFSYPIAVHVRKHGPSGYADYGSYRDWLRDEFSFCCVFCRKREQWDIMIGSWDIDHFVPQDIRPDQKLDYENLLYVCHACNLIKSKKIAPDPCAIAFGACVEIHEDGSIDALNEDGQALIETLKLDNEDHRKYRRLIIAMLRSLAIHDMQVYRLWICYPADLPDLSRLNPPSGNTRPSGVIDSFFARRARGELPQTYSVTVKPFWTQRRHRKQYVRWRHTHAFRIELKVKRFRFSNCRDKSVHANSGYAIRSFPC